MKLIETCGHLVAEDAEMQKLAQLLGTPEHEGRAFLIRELCADCLVDEVVRTQGVPVTETELEALKVEARAFFPTGNGKSDADRRG